jgi:hydroxymethylbilane synthase
LRGNVATRLAHIAAGDADATLLAAAGLDRLGMPDVGHALALDQFLPAASQGAVGIDRLSSRADLIPLIEAINHPPTFAAVMAERNLLEALGGNCHSPVAAYAQFDDGKIRLRAEIFTNDGREMQAGDEAFDADEHGPARLAADLLSRSSAELRAIFNP